MLGIDCCSMCSAVLRCGACRSYSESVVPLVQMIVIFWGVTTQWTLLFPQFCTASILQWRKCASYVGSFRVVQLVADMEGGKKRVKDFSQTNGNRVFVDCNNHILVEVNILGIVTKMRIRLKLDSGDMTLHHTQKRVSPGL